MASLLDLIMPTTPLIHDLFDLKRRILENDIWWILGATKDLRFINTYVEIGKEIDGVLPLPPVLEISRK